MLKNCKIIGDGVAYEVYSRQEPGVTRGKPGFIMSRSELIDFFNCPEKWLAAVPSEGDTDSTRFGKLLEAIECNPVAFGTLFAVEPEFYTNSKGAKAEWDYRSSTCREWREEHEKKGLTVISAATLAEGKSAAKLCADYAPRAELIACSRKQVMVIGEWHDKDTKITVPPRCLIDLVPAKEHPVWGKCLADGKTSRNGNPAQWARVVDDSGYDVQAALSLDLYLAATKEDRTDWVFPLSENQPPFHVVKPMPSLSAEFISWARLKYQAALKLYAQCLKTGVWPSYPMAGMPYGPLQIIGPDGLWSYRQMAGQGTLNRGDAYQPEPEPEKLDDKGDIAP
jgi:hypothetical protein